jgi:hypothetical protein
MSGDVKLRGSLLLPHDEPAAVSTTAVFIDQQEWGLGFSLRDTSKILKCSYYGPEKLQFPLENRFLILRTKRKYSSYIQLQFLSADTVIWFSSASDRVRSQIRSCMFCGEQNCTEAGFIRVLRFLLPILIPPDSSYSSIIRGWYNRSVSGWRTEWTQSRPTPRN